MPDETVQPEVRTDPANPFSTSVADARVMNRVKITDADKIAFYKCFLADKPFTETVKLFGQFPVTFRTLTVTENNDVFRQVVFDQKNGTARNDDAYLITLVSYRVALSIQDMDGVPFLQEVNKENVKEDVEKGISYVSERARAFKSWPTFKLSALLDAFRVFDLKVIQLVEQVGDPNFWPAAK